MTVETVNRCACGKAITRWSVRCIDCQEKAIIAAATTVEPSAPLSLVNSDTFYSDLREASECDAGRHAHPCDQELLQVNIKRLAEDLEERVVDDMCEEAFEDAADFVRGRPELLAALEAALAAFNDAQTAYTWTPRTGEVFVVPASVDTHPKDGDVKQAPLVSGAVRDSGDAQ